MARLKQKLPATGFFGVGILHGGDETNIGTLWRSAYVMGASFIFTIDHKYQRQSGDVVNAWSRIPLYHYPSFDAFQTSLPFSTCLVGVEMDERAVPLGGFEHPPRAVYLLGSEKSGLPPKVLEACHALVALPGCISLNVAVAGSIVLYDRQQKRSA